MLILALLTGCTPSIEVPYTNDPMLDVDVNGDGYADILMVGTVPILGGEDFEGRAALWWGGPEGIADEPDQSIDDVYTGMQFAGDANGDSYSDFLVAVAGQGTAAIYGGPSGIPETPPAILPFSNMDPGAAPLGDVNCDGYSDTLVTGGVILWGSADGFTATAIDGTDPGASVITENGAELGGIQPLGDINNDGCDDLISSGLILYGDASGYRHDGTVIPVSTSSPWIMPRGIDVNSDGINDAFIGSDVYYGGADGLTLATFAEDEWPSINTLWSATGDISGDGLDDAAISGSSFPTQGGGGGTSLTTAEVEQYFQLAASRGGHDFINPIEDESSWFSWTAPDRVLQDALGVMAAGTQSYASVHTFGATVGSVGDVDGDGARDLVVSAHYRSFAFIYQGGPALKRVGPEPTWTAEGGGGAIAGLWVVR